MLGSGMSRCLPPAAVRRSGGGMQGWVKTLDGRDVFEQGDGWIFYGRSQQWCFEPNLLVMPAAPMGARVGREVDRLSTGWPSLRQAWSFKSTRVRGFYDVLRGLALLAPVYILWHLPVFIKAHTMAGAADPLNTYGIHETCVALGLVVLSHVCLWIIWLDHVSKVDRHKSDAVVAAVYGTVAVIRINRWLKHRQRGGW
jgi:hypothetical protein